MLGEIKKQFPLTLVALRTIGRTKSKWLSVFLVWLIVVFAREACAQSSPAISVQPQDQSVVQGIDAAFSVLASGQAPLAYAWYYEGALLLDDGYHTQGAASPQLIISNALTDDAGSYWVTVSNRHGMVTSKVATLTVIVPPSVTTQPSNQVVSLGVNVAINATATGSSPLSFRWQKDGVNLTDNGHVSGANDSTLTISSVQPGDIGNYRLIVTNVYGATTSAVGNLMVQPLMVWGASNTVPEAFTNAVAVAAGAYHEQYVYLGLKSDSTVAGWGATVPAGLRNVVAVSAGYRHGLALGSDGSVTGFGDNSFG